MKKFIDWVVYVVFLPEPLPSFYLLRVLHVPLTGSCSFWHPLDDRFGPEEDDSRAWDDDRGFREARSSGRATEEDEYDEEFHRSIRRRNATHPSHGTVSSRRLDASGGGVIDLQVGSRVFNDVPAKMRSELWMSKLHSSSSSPSLSSPLATYEDCLGREVDPNVLQEIEKDIHRTFPGHVTLTSPAGQAAMRNVLRAYASYDPGM